MDLLKYLSVMVVLCFNRGEVGGHGGKHHDHIKIHIPEFIHHDHHTKVITIHHHHHKPKEHHHHHHHHHHKPHGHHVHHHHKKSHSVHKGHTTVTKGHHGHHGHHGHKKHHEKKHHGHHGHHGHHEDHGYHGYHGYHGSHHHHDLPAISYDTPTYEEEYGTYSPPAASYPGTPQLHGVKHSVKKVKVYDSLPGVIPTPDGLAENGGGYQVKEEGADEEDITITSVKSVQEAFPGTFGFLNGAAPQQSHDPFAEFAPQTTIQTQGHDVFSTAAQPTVLFNGHTGLGKPFTVTAQGGIYASPSAPSAPSPPPTSPSAAPASEFQVNFQTQGFHNPTNSFVGVISSTPILAAADIPANDKTPVTYHREAGIQQTVKKGGIETVVYK